MLDELLTPDNFAEIIASVVALIGIIGGWGIWAGRKEKKDGVTQAPIVSNADILNAVNGHNAAVMKELSDAERRDQFVRDAVIRLEARKSG